MYFAPVSTAFLSFAVKCVCLLGEVYCCLVLLGYLLLSFMFNPWALLFYIVCLLFYFGFLFLLSFPLDRSRASNIFSFLISKARFPNWVLHFFLFIFWFVSFSWTGSSCLFVVVSRAFYLFGINGCERSWVFVVFLHWQFWKSTFLLNFCYVKKSLFVDFVHNLFWTNLSPKFFFLYPFCLLLVVELLLRFLHQNVLAKRLNGLNIFVCSGFCMRFFSKELWEWLK